MRVATPLEVLYGRLKERKEYSSVTAIKAMDGLLTDSDNNVPLTLSMTSKFAGNLHRFDFRHILIGRVTELDTSLSHVRETSSIHRLAEMD